MWWRKRRNMNGQPANSTATPAATSEPPGGQRAERIGRVVGWGGRVFLSHTSELAAWPQPRSCVDQALAAVAESDYLGLDMKHFSAQDRPPAKVCVEAVRPCGVYLAVIGFRYGSLVPDRDISYTELEFDTATAMGIPRIIILLGSDSGAPIEQDPEKARADRERVQRFRHRLTWDEGLTVKFVNSAGEVHAEVRKSLQLVPPPGWHMYGPEGSAGVRGHIERRGRGHRATDGGGDLFRGRARALPR